MHRRMFKCWLHLGPLRPIFYKAFSYLKLLARMFLGVNHNYFYIELQKDLVGQHAPVLLFGVTSVIAGGLSTSFPETLNKKLPDTVNQAKMVDES